MPRLAEKEDDNRNLFYADAIVTKGSSNIEATVRKRRPFFAFPFARMDEERVGKKVMCSKLKRG